MRRNVFSLDSCPEIRDFLKALASETRQKIVFLFVDGEPRTVGQIASELQTGQSTASEHLAILKRGGLLDSEREGKEVYYRPNRGRILGILKKLSDCLTACCPE